MKTEIAIISVLLCFCLIMPASSQILPGPATSGAVMLLALLAFDLYVYMVTSSDVSVYDDSSPAQLDPDIAQLLSPNQILADSTVQEVSPGNWTMCYKYWVHCWTDYSVMSQWEACEYFTTYPNGTTSHTFTNTELIPAICPEPCELESQPVLRKENRSVALCNCSP
jgi:hypothetical protein